MRMNISVPDKLAGEVRRLDIPVSAICQRALQQEADRLNAIAPGIQAEFKVMQRIVEVAEGTPSEVAAGEAIRKLISELDGDDARERVLHWASDRYPFLAAQMKQAKEAGQS